MCFAILDTIFDLILILLKSHNKKRRPVARRWSEAAFFTEPISLMRTWSLPAKAGLQLDTLDEQRLKKIKELEHYERPQAQEVEPEQQKPVFLTPLNRYD